MTAITKTRRVGCARRHTLALTTALCLPCLAFASTPLAESDVPVPNAGTSLVGHTSTDRPMSLTIALPSRDITGAEAFVHSVGDRNNPSYRRYLTPAQYAARFGAKDDDYAAVFAWARSAGLTLGETFSAHTVVPVSGTAAAFEGAFGVTINDYKDASGRIFHAPTGQAQVPQALAERGVAVIGLSNQFKPRGNIVQLPSGTPSYGLGTGPQGAFNAADLRSIYDVPQQLSTKFPQTIALFEQGGFQASDVTAYLKANKLHAVPLQVRSVDGYGSGVDDPGVELEAVLDIDMVTAINPTVSKIIVYEDGADGFSFQSELLDSLAAIASDDKAQTVSISYGQDEALQGRDAIAAEKTVLMQLAAQGQAVFASSGDTGAYGDEAPTKNVADPASQPYVTGVGGTTVIPSHNQSYFAEQAWNELNVPVFFSFDGLGATGGGVSKVWPLPAFQNSQLSGFSARRNVPDVAAVGDPLTGVAVYSALNNGWVTVGGTSVASPIWAGIYSLANVASQTLGFGQLGYANSLLYNLGSPIGSGFHDIVEGSNGNQTLSKFHGYLAGLGYDDTTGLGTFDGQFLVATLALSTITEDTGRNFPVPANITAAAKATSITVGWKQNPGDVAYFATVVDDATQKVVNPAITRGSSLTFTNLIPNTLYVALVYGVSKKGYTLAPPVYVTTGPK